MNKLHFSIPVFLFTISCEQVPVAPDSGKDPQDTNKWLIPSDEVFDGGPGKDGIPAISTTYFMESKAVNHDYLSDDDLILAIKHDNMIKAYPHPILDWHEIINDGIGDFQYAVNYCPLTGTGMAWQRNLNGNITTFGVSGLLYNTNLILYDRLTDSYWSQMSLMSVKGELSGQDAEVHSMLEMTWGEWKKIYPDEMVAVPPKNYTRPYGSYPYGDYKINDDYLLFPVSVSDESLPAKERVFGVFEDKENVRIYRINNSEHKYLFIQDNFKGTEFYVAGLSDDFLVAYKKMSLSGKSISLRIAEDKLPVLFVDNEGSEWDVFGHAINGPNEGEVLEKMTFISGFWFTFPSFFSNTEIYDFNPKEFQ